MSEFFLSVVNMSISASWIALVVLLLRLVLKKAPKWITVLLWAIVAIRLIVPFAFESEMSLMPSAQTISPGIMNDSVPQIYTGIASVNNAINPVIGQSFAPDLRTSANPLQIWIPIAAALWGIGMLALAIYTAVSYLRIKSKVKTAILLQDKVFLSENIASPFVLGFFKPKIYLPFQIDQQDIAHVIAHENAHIRRRDHWWKPIGFAILSVHWFNPLVWLSYVLLCRDIELACDEKVVKELDSTQRADYSQALLNCSVSRRMIASCPLAFGEVSVKDRVKSVLNYKKTAFWLIVVAILISVAIALCFLTNPVSVSMERIEFVDLSERIENTASVWISDGASYQRADEVSQELLQDLARLKISKEEISLNRSEDRDQSHTLLLQTQEDAQPSPSSYLEGLRIHFNSDFTAVWANNGVKPTLSYRITQPKKAKEIYEKIAAYSVQTPKFDIAPWLDSDRIETLKARYPMYFDLGTFKGLEVYIWQMAENSYSCGVLPGLNRNYTPQEIWRLHLNSASLEEMRAIIASYIASGEISQIDVTIVPVSMPHSSYAYTIDDAYRQKLNDLFWSDFPIFSIELGDYTLPNLAIAIFDIDGDQKDETCYITPGPTSGLFTFCISAYEEKELEYFNIFCTPWMDLRFETDADGQTVLIGDAQDETYYMTLSIDDGNIVIMGEDADITYWGVQGINSPNAPIETIETIEGNFRTYYRMSNGTWKYGDYIYKYRLEITGRMPNAVADTTYVYLSNIANISFQRAMWASGISSSLDDYFAEEDAVLVEIWTHEEETPTGYESGEIQQPQIRYNGKVYFYFATGFDAPLSQGYVRVGAVESVDNTQPPQKDFCGARVELGQSIYANKSDPSTIYVKYDTGYAKFSIKE